MNMKDADKHVLTSKIKCLGQTVLEPAMIEISAKMARKKLQPSTSNGNLILVQGTDQRFGRSNKNCFKDYNKLNA